MVRLRRFWKHRGSRARIIIVALCVLMVFAQVAFASTPTPIPPTETPVLLTIPINSLFDQTNNWLATLAPIAAIGIGISLAVAVLAYLGKMIKSAFV